MKAQFFFALILTTAQLNAEDNTLQGLTLENLLNVPIDAASFAGEKPSDAAALTYVITEDTILNRGYGSLIELLADMPQFELQRNASVDMGNIVTVQGINGNERLQIFIDGVRVTPVTGNFYALGRQFSLKNALRVEIVLGPMSALYGADAFSGVINIVTKTGKEIAGAGAESAAGNNSYMDYSAVAGAGLDIIPFTEHSLLPDSAAALTFHNTGLSNSYLPKQYKNDFSWYKSGYSETGLMGLSARTNSTTAVPVRSFSADTASTFAHARLNLGNFELAMINMSETHSSSLGIQPKYSLYVKDAIVKTKYSTFYAKHNYSSEDDNWNFTSLFAENYYEIEPDTKFINSFSNYQDAYKYARDKSTSFEEKVARKIGEKSVVLLGLSYQDILSLPRTADLDKEFNPNQSADSQGFVYTGSDITDAGGRYLGVPQDFYYTQYHNTGLYAQLQFRDYAPIQATLGLRYDRNSRYGDSINPRAGIIIKPAKKVNLKLLYGEAFLAPSPDKSYQHYGTVYADTTTTSGLRSDFFQLPNPDLKPEKIRSFQGEATLHFSNSVWTTLSGYQTYIYDMIRVNSTGSGSFKEIPVKSISRYLNSDKLGKIHGATLRVDTLAKFELLELGSYAAITYSGGYSEATDFLPYSANYSVKAGVDAKHGRLSISPRLIYQTCSYNRQKDIKGNLQSSDPFAVLNLTAKYAHIPAWQAELSIFLNVENLTNTRYYNPTRAPLEGFPASPQQPRTIFGGATLLF